MSRVRKSCRQEKVAAGALLFDHLNYQRRPNTARVKLFSDEWDPDLVGCIIVSRRADGELYVIDGQHRVLVVIASCGLDTLMDALVHNGLSLADEARMFAGINMRRGPVPIGKGVQAQITAGNPKWISIRDLLMGMGIEYLFDGPIVSGRVTKAWGGMEIIYRRGGLALLERAVRMALDAFGNDRHALESNVLKGFADFILRYEGDEFWSEKEAESRLSDIVYKDIAKRQKTHRAEGRAPDLSWSYALRDVYNLNKSTRRIGQQKEKSVL